MVSDLHIGDIVHYIYENKIKSLSGLCIYIYISICLCIKYKEMFEVTKSVIRTRKSKKDIQYNGEKKEQTMICKTLSRKHKIEQDEPQ